MYIQERENIRLSLSVQLNTRLESVCNFALQLESEVQVGHQAHSQLEEQFEMLSQVHSLNDETLTHIITNRRRQSWNVN